MTATVVLLIGRGRSLPELSVALGERIGVIVALSAERAAARSTPVTSTASSSATVSIRGSWKLLLTVLADDVRFRDLPVAVLGGQLGNNANIVEPYCLDLPNLERINDGVARLALNVSCRSCVCTHSLVLTAPPRMLASLDAKGMIDPDTEALGARKLSWRDLEPRCRRSGKSGVGLSRLRGFASGAQ